MNFLQIAILALIQGAAELLPISSSAHVIVAERLMGVDPSSPEATFLLVMLHTGTMGAVLVYFWRRWMTLLAGSASKTGEASGAWHFCKMVILATAATGILGLGLMFLIEKIILGRILGNSQGEIEHLFKNLPLMAVSLLAVGMVIIAAGTRESTTQVRLLTSRSSLGIGLVQGLVLPFRGFSRSGATISAGLMYGLSRSLAEEFSFALAVVLTPPVIVRELYRLLKASHGQENLDLMNLLVPGLVGMVLSFLAGLAALRLLSRALEKGSWKYFGYYCLAASFLVGSAGFWLPPLPD
jgi:undecaprenyl-diphosphatase